LALLHQPHHPNLSNISRFGLHGSYLILDKIVVVEFSNHSDHSEILEPIAFISGIFYIIPLFIKIGPTHLCLSVAYLTSIRT
jgi:hypothetical protein